MLHTIVHQVLNINHKSKIINHKLKNIVIAAGYATRLGELTKNFPKPLLQIGQNTILGRMMDDIDRIPQIDERNRPTIPIL